MHTLVKQIERFTTRKCGFSKIRSKKEKTFCFLTLFTTIQMTLKNIKIVKLPNLYLTCGQDFNIINAGAKMNRDELFEKLDTLKLDKDKYFILSGASLVAQNIIEQTNDIDIACDISVYNSLDWEKSMGAFNKEIKHKNCFDISNNLYDMKNKTVVINGYRFADLENILTVKLLLNRSKDQEIIQKLKSLIKQ